MISYLKFLLFVNLKKKGLYICFLSLVATFSMLFFASVDFSNTEHKEQGLFPIDRFVRWFPFVFSTLFSTLLIVRTFKKGEKDGTELLISAKPITRKKIILAKFINIYIILIIFHIILFAFYISISQIDSYANASQKIRFAATMTIGGIIISLIVISIVILLSYTMGSMGTIVIGVMFSAIIPVLSFAIIPISNAVSPTHFYKKWYLEKKINNYLLPEVSKNGSADYDIEKQKRIALFDSTEKEDIKKNRDTWYQYAKYFDLWYQWERFYSLLAPKVKSKDNFSYEVKNSNYKEVDSEEFAKIIETGIKTAINFKSNEDRKDNYYIGIFSKDELNFEKNQLSKILDEKKYKNLTKKNGSLSNLIKEIREEIIKKEEEERETEKISDVEFTNQRIKIYQEVLNKKFLKNNEKIENIKYYRIMLWRAINEFEKNNVGTFTSWVLLQQFLTPYYEGSATSYINIGELEENREVIAKKIANNKFIAIDYKETDYLETKPIILFYSIAGIIFIVISIIVCLRKDFK